MKIVFARRALREIDRSARWWIAHRDARMLFEQELALVIQQIRTDPGLGQLYRVVRNRRQLRVLMPKTRHHVYYRLDGPDRVIILSVWGATRRQGPKLR